MVGVAGKSRACYDCKRRRVKCDFRKPTCLRCEKASLSCQGYDKRSIFVNRTLKKPSTTALVAISEARLLSSPEICRPASKLLQMFQRLQASISDLSSSPVAFRAQAWEILKDLYLPHAQYVDEINFEATTPYSWVAVACQMSLESSILDQSLLAFCAVQISIAEPWSISMDRALQLYSEALPELAQNLGYSHEQSKDETLAAIVILSTCELFVVPNDDGWRAHAHGISELLRHRDLSDDRSVVWLKLCSRLRIICVIIALRERTRLALDPETWRQLMGVDTASESLESLLDIISEVPILLEETDKVMSSGATDTTLLQTLLRVFERFCAWQQLYRLQSGGPLYWAVPSRFHNPSDTDFAKKLYPFALEYTSLNVAIQLNFSSAVMLQVLSAVLQLLEGGNSDLYKELDRNQFPNRHYHDDGLKIEELSWSVPTIKREANRLARFLCQSIEYCFRREMGTLGAQTTCHSQWALRSYFRQVGLERELEWCRCIKGMYGPGFRHGFTLMMFGSEDGSL